MVATVDPVAAEVVLAVIERQGMVVLQKPGLPMLGVGPKGWDVT